MKKKKIDKGSREELKNKLGKHEERGDSFITDEFEVVLENGWAYVHGRGPLHGTSTNITSIDELPDAIKRLKAAKEI